jgi:hypothetical protein
LFSLLNSLFKKIVRGVAQPGSVRRSGRRSRRFKSCHPDNQKGYIVQVQYDPFFMPDFFKNTILGIAHDHKYYGNEFNVMAEILLNRYEQFIVHGLLTHITTNLSASEIEEYYGNRVRSRMREMFNLEIFNTNSKDKRM